MKSIARQLLSALRYLAAQSFVHRDINPANIVFAQDHAALIDFQTAVCFSSASGVTGTAPYQAPEMWQAANYDGKADVWALGLTLQKLLRSSETSCSAAAQKVVTWCLQEEPEQRCSAEQALECAWFL